MGEGEDRSRQVELVRRTFVRPLVCNGGLNCFSSVNVERFGRLGRAEVLLVDRRVMRHGLEAQHRFGYLEEMEDIAIAWRLLSASHPSRWRYPHCSPAGAF